MKINSKISSFFEILKNQIKENYLIYIIGLASFLFITILNYGLLKIAINFVLIFLALNTRNNFPKLKYKKINYKDIIVLVFLIISNLFCYYFSNKNIFWTFDEKLFAFVCSLVVLSFIFDENIIKNIRIFTNNLFKSASVAIICNIPVIVIFALMTGLFGASFNSIDKVLTFIIIFSGISFWIYNDDNILIKENLSENKKDALNKIFYFVLNLVQVLIFVWVLSYIISIGFKKILPRNVLAKFITFYYIAWFVKIYLFEDNTKFKEKISNVFWYSSPIFIVFFFVALMERINNYGFTTQRYFMFLFGIFLIIINILYFTSKKNNFLRKIIILWFIMFNFAIYSENYLVKYLNENFLNSEKIKNNKTETQKREENKHYIDYPNNLRAITPKIKLILLDELDDDEKIIVNNDYYMVKQDYRIIKVYEKDKKIFWFYIHYPSVEDFKKGKTYILVDSKKYNYFDFLDFWKKNKNSSGNIENVSEIFYVVDFKNWELRKSIKSFEIDDKNEKIIEIQGGEFYIFYK